MWADSGSLCEGVRKRDVLTSHLASASSLPLCCYSGFWELFGACHLKWHLGFSWHEVLTGKALAHCLSLQLLQVFDELLLDADFSVNAGSWMWLSCSAFFQQFFHCYCPVGFGRRTDPSGDYVKWVMWLELLSCLICELKSPSSWQVSGAFCASWMLHCCALRGMCIFLFVAGGICPS